MTPQVEQSIRHFDAQTPLNVNGLTGGVETAQVFHEIGPGPLIPGTMEFGTVDSVNRPVDFDYFSARVFAHQHPFSPGYKSESASMGDQIIARENPHLEHIVQTPAPTVLDPNGYITYSGAFPPRHYTLVPNPDNLPVPPPSPDGVAPFHPFPA